MLIMKIKMLILNYINYAFFLIEKIFYLKGIIMLILKITLNKYTEELNPTTYRKIFIMEEVLGW